jgi:hypothetical protein
MPPRTCSGYVLPMPMSFGGRQACTASSVVPASKGVTGIQKSESSVRCSHASEKDPFLRLLQDLAQMWTLFVDCCGGPRFR